MRMERLDARSCTAELVGWLNTAMHHSRRIVSGVNIRKDDCGNSAMCECMAFVVTAAIILVIVPITTWLPLRRWGLPDAADPSGFSVHHWCSVWGFIMRYYGAWLLCILRWWRSGRCLLRNVPVSICCLLSVAGNSSCAKREEFEVFPERL